MMLFFQGEEPSFIDYILPIFLSLKHLFAYRIVVDYLSPPY